MTMMLPGSTIGILGGGQLGRMMAMEGRRLGYRIGVLDPTPNSPAAQVADFSIQSELSNLQGLLELANQVDVITVETELVPWKLLANLEVKKTARPSSFVLALVQDRLVQRQFLQDQNYPQTLYASVKDRAGIPSAAQRVGFPAILKTRRAGYDGKGQILVQNMDDLHAAWESHGEVPSILEAVALFHKELSVILARGLQGDIQLYPVAENVHQHHSLHTTVAPARISEAVKSRAGELAVSLAQALDYCGVMAVEFFLLDDDTLLINEIAPRPHNSGHFTLGGCITSQFEQHLRAICGLPLGDPTLMKPMVMVNLMGDLWQNGPPQWDILFSQPQAQLHLYGKDQPRPGRKMGHVLFPTENVDHTLQQAEILLQNLATEPPQPQNFGSGDVQKQAAPSPNNTMEIQV